MLHRVLQFLRVESWFSRGSKEPTSYIPILLQPARAAMDSSALRLGGILQHSTSVAKLFPYQELNPGY